MNRTDHDRALVEARRNARLDAYNRLREEWPRLFENPHGAAFEILFDRAEQDLVAEVAAKAAIEQGLSEDCGDIGVIYHDRYLRLVRDAVRFPSGHTGTYIRAVPVGAAAGAAVLPVLSDGRVILLRHFRHADRQWHWEIPRGFGDAGEGGTATAGREVREELGCAAGELVHLGAIATDTGMGSGQDDIYLAHVDTQSFCPTPSPTALEEGISELRALAPDEFRSMLLDGHVSDAYTLAAYAYATARGLLHRGNQEY